jgi:hypothetical protein
MERSGRAAFRSLWRAQQQVFANDAAAQTEAKRRIRAAFRTAKVTTPREREQNVRVAEDTARLLRDTVVQAKLNPDKLNYRAQFGKQHVTSKGEPDSEIL